MDTSTVDAPPVIAKPVPKTLAALADEDGMPLQPNAPSAPRANFKSDFWLPIPSLFLPGFGQYFQGEWVGLGYTGAAFAGIYLSVDATSRLADQDAGFDPSRLFDGEDWDVRELTLGSMLYQGSGFLSAYSAFRSSVPLFQKEDGRYRFLKARESLGDMALAPVRFGHLGKASTFVPLGLLAGVLAYLVIDERSTHSGSDWAFSADDLGYSGPLAYNAGLTEEAVFRGWLLPVAYEYSKRSWWFANGAQAGLFALAHYNRANPVPWPQFLLGWYFGSMTRKNGWTLSESIFLHAWWDGLLFLSQALTSRRVDGGSAFRIAFPLPL
ncbi:MAG: CPBP family intramembrane glutamic endopeptidase [Fibrobacteria bacterium]